jgi:hypothetical protein
MSDSSSNNQYYICSIKHTNRNDFVVNWWAPNGSGYNVKIDKAGKYSYDYILGRGYLLGQDKLNFGISCSDIDKLAIPMEYHFAIELELGLFVLNSKEFRSKYNISTKDMYPGSSWYGDKRLFKIIPEYEI